MKLAATSILLGLILMMATIAYAEDGGSSSGTMGLDTVLGEAEGFFGAGAEGIASVIQKAFEDYGEPVGFIKGREAGGAVVVGLRYGDGELLLNNGFTRTVHWQGPSVGVDFGGNAAKVFVLVYGLPSVESIFQRFPGVDGSLYFVGGAGLNYNKRDDIVLAPIRLGVGWRAGANVGYMKITPEKTWNPL